MCSMHCQNWDLGSPPIWNMAGSLFQSQCWQIVIIGIRMQAHWGRADLLPCPAAPVGGFWARLVKVPHSRKPQDLANLSGRVWTQFSLAWSESGPGLPGAGPQCLAELWDMVRDNLRVWEKVFHCPSVRSGWGKLWVLNPAVLFSIPRGSSGSNIWDTGYTAMEEGAHILLGACLQGQVYKTHGT